MTSKLLTVLDFYLKKSLQCESTLTIDLGVARVRCKSNSPRYDREKLTLEMACY